MSLPVDGYPMPFSVPQHPTGVGTQTFDVRPENQIPGGRFTSSVPISPGRSMVIFTWDGAEGIRDRIERKINGVWTFGNYHEIIPPGVAGVSRSSAPVSIASAEKLSTSIFIRSTHNHSQATIDAGATASVDVVTIPPPVV